MKDKDSDSRQAIEESPPELEVQETETPTVFDKQQNEAASINLGSGQTVTLNWLYAKSIARMKCVGCPFAQLCGQELAHETYLLAQQSDLTGVSNMEAWMSTIINRRSLNKVRDCHCGSMVEFVEAGEAIQTDQDEEVPASTIPLSAYPPQVATPARVYDDALLIEAVRLQLKDDHERQLFDLLYWEGMSQKEVALLLGIKDATLRKRAERLNKKLRETLVSLSTRR